MQFCELGRYLVNVPYIGTGPVPAMLKVHDVGGATGRIGDPSGRSSERSLLSSQTLDHNLAGLQKEPISWLA